MIVSSNPTQVMDVCVRLVRVSVALRRPDRSSKESYRLCKEDYGTKEEARAQQRDVEPSMNEWINNVRHNFIINLLENVGTSIKLLKTIIALACTNAQYCLQFSVK
jgi:hypothetical protein